MSPDPRHTLPTTRYVTSRHELSSARPADFAHDLPQPAHWPLVVMLVLTQWAIGTLVTERLLSLGFALTIEGETWQYFGSIMASSALVVAAIGLAIANLHLGRPALAFRAVLGWRTSWLSREVLAFAGFLAVGWRECALTWGPSEFGLPSWSAELLGWLTAAAGIFAASTSAMVYVGTQREVWSARRVFQQFSGSILLLGMTSGLVVLNLGRIYSLEFRHSPFAAFIACLLLDAITVLSSTRLFNARRATRRYSFLNHAAGAQTLDSRIVALLTGPLAFATTLRSVLGMSAGCIFVLLVATQSTLSESVVSQPVAMFQIALAGMVVLVRLASEILECYLFFVTAVTAGCREECRDSGSRPQLLFCDRSRRRSRSG